MACAASGEISACPPFRDFLHRRKPKTPPESTLLSAGAVWFGVGADITCEAGGTRVGFVNPEVGEADEADAMAAWILTPDRDIGEAFRDVLGSKFPSTSVQIIARQYFTNWF